MRATIACNVCASEGNEKNRLYVELMEGNVSTFSEFSIRVNWLFVIVQFSAYVLNCGECDPTSALRTLQTASAFSCSNISASVDFSRQK
uniref:Uncharacterized protein n=1 Tax=Setaria digitata TaxID=48799 RepID=A0A915Q008_9BILA